MAAQTTAFGEAHNQEARKYTGIPSFLFCVVHQSPPPAFSFGNDIHPVANVVYSSGYRRIRVAYKVRSCAPPPSPHVPAIIHETAFLISPSV